MKTYYSPRTELHSGQPELTDGQLRPSDERMERARHILGAVNTANLGPVVEPENFPLDNLIRVHNARYIDFLRNVADEWAKMGFQRPALASFWRPREYWNFEPSDIHGRLGYWSFDGACPILPDTFEAVRASANCALSGVRDIVAGARAVFALCRPPGHHAHADCMGGFCYVNNAGVAAQALLDAGLTRVGILDIDAHHGNGTQSLFYARSDVIVANIHTDPCFDYPFFSGRMEERGEAAGRDANFNYPLAKFAAYDFYEPAIDDALSRIKIGCEAIVVSLGLDAHEDDPGGKLKLTSDDFSRIGRKLGRTGLPLLFVLEGGYNLHTIGQLAVRVLGEASAA